MIYYCIVYKNLIVEGNKRISKVLFKFFFFGFDDNYYLSKNTDVRNSNLHPFEHFCKYGYKEFRSPNKLFDPVAIAVRLKTRNIFLIYIFRRLFYQNSLKIPSLGAKSKFFTFLRLFKKFNIYFLRYAKHHALDNYLPTIVFIESLPPLEKLGQGIPRVNSILSVLKKKYNIIYIYRNSSFRFSFLNRVIFQIQNKNIFVFGPFNDQLILYLFRSLEQTPNTFWISKLNNIKELSYIIKHNNIQTINLKIISDTEALSKYYESADNFTNFPICLFTEYPNIFSYKDLVINNSDHFVVVNEQDKCELIQDLPARKISILGHTLPTLEKGNEFFERKGLIFLGNCSDHSSSNSLSLEWFVNNVYSELLLRSPDISFTVIGQINKTLENSLSTFNVNILGPKKNLGRYMREAKVFIAPNLVSQGIPLKVHLAASYGLPSVIMPQLAIQLGWANGIECLTGSNITELLKAINRLCSNEELWNQIHLNLTNRIMKENSFEAFEDSLFKILKEI